MLIVKGENAKSCLANTLMQNTKSICFQYYDAPVVWNSFIVDNTIYSLDNFIKFIEGILKGVKTRYDYLIIYTNEKERDLKKLFDWLNDYVPKEPLLTGSGSILVMCKE